MHIFSKLRASLNKYLLTQNESQYIKGGLLVDPLKGKSYGCPPPFDEE
ncbi:MAG: hypothetical protein R3E32_08950 [Chitinophagales bacterium]